MSPARTQPAPAFRALVAGTSVLGIGVLAALCLDPPSISHHWLLRGILLLAPGVLIGELVPIKIPRRGDDEAITFSTTFAFALLLVAGPLVAAGSLSVASIVQDVFSRKPLWRSIFNIAQYTLCIAAAALVLWVLTPVPRSGTHPFTTADLPGVIAAAAAMFLVNVGIVGTAVALYQGVDPRAYFRRDFGFSASTGLVLLCLSPIVVAAAQFSWALIPLFVSPVLVMYQFSRRSAAQAQHDLMHDALTGLASRAQLRVAGAEAFGALRAGRCEQVTVFVLDIDRFKAINDTLGHHCGDRVLQEVGRRIAGVIHPGDLAVRQGGDEFVILSTEPKSVEEAVRHAERVCAALRPPVELDGMTLEAVGSIGVACAPMHAGSLDDLLRRADVAMYSAKERNAGVAAYAAQHERHSSSRLALVPALRNGIESDELMVCFQPKLTLATSTLRGVEALVRWRRDGQIIPPGQFVPLAETTGLIRPLTQWVLDATLRQCREWTESGRELSVGINVSPRSLLDSRFADDVAEALERWNVPAAMLQLEITEQTMLTDPDTALAVLKRLRALGVSLAIDDFGTGFSSLNYLRDMPVDEIKIDRSFVTGMTASPRDAVLVRSIIELAHNLDLPAIAEGVEDEHCLELLRDLECDAAQGFHIGRPLPADMLAPLVLPPDAVAAVRECS